MRNLSGRLSRLERLPLPRRASGVNPTLALLGRDPVLPFAAAGLSPDPWQAEFLADPCPRQTVLACRRAGKSVAAAAKTLRHCLTRPDALALVFSPTSRQSSEFVRAALGFDAALGRLVRRVRDNLTSVEWANGSRLLSLPDSHAGVVGFTPTLVVIDEASRVSDTLYRAMRPMLALDADLITLSTPFGRRGWFYETWSDPERLARFRRWRVTADDCPRISPAFLDEERLELGDRWFRQEYYAAFEEAVDAVFSREVIARAARADAAAPLSLGE